MRRDEVDLIVGDRIRAEEGLQALERDGLAHGSGTLWLLTRAAVRGRALAWGPAS